MSIATDIPSPEIRYRRVILKLSGEVLGSRETGETLCPEHLEAICRDVQELHQLGVQVAVVIGGGNIFRGLSGARNRGVDRVTGDSMGMLATVINGLALMDTLERMGVPARVQSAIPMEKICETFIARTAIQHLEAARVLILVGGTGNPFFSTDTCSALRASEIGADVILKATKVDGVYDKDPVKYPNAVKFESLTFSEALVRGIEVMDAAAFALCRENNINILVLRMSDKGAMRRAICGQKVGTLVHR